MKRHQTCEARLVPRCEVSFGSTQRLVSIFWTVLESITSTHSPSELRTSDVLGQGDGIKEGPSALCFSFHTFNHHTHYILTMARFHLLSFFIVSIQFVCLFPRAFAQDAPLFIQGGLEDATAVDDSYNSGGTITVNGFNVQVPKNLQVQFPAAWVAWKDFTAEKASMLGYEINVPFPHLRSNTTNHILM
jgi:hypothetical protein